MTDVSIIPPSRHPRATRLRALTNLDVDGNLDVAVALGLTTEDGVLLVRGLRSAATPPHPAGCASCGRASGRGCAVCRQAWEGYV